MHSSSAVERHRTRTLTLPSPSTSMPAVEAVLVAALVSRACRPTNILSIPQKERKKCRGWEKENKNENVKWNLDSAPRDSLHRDSLGCKIWWCRREDLTLGSSAVRPVAKSAKSSCISQQTNNKMIAFAKVERAMESWCRCCHRCWSCTCNSQAANALNNAVNSPNLCSKFKPNKKWKKKNKAKGKCAARLPNWNLPRRTATAGRCKTIQARCNRQTVGVSADKGGSGRPLLCHVLLASDSLALAINIEADHCDGDTSNSPAQPKLTLHTSIFSHSLRLSLALSLPLSLCGYDANCDACHSVHCSRLDWALNSIRWAKCGKSGFYISPNLTRIVP